MPFVIPDPDDPFMPRKGAARRSAVPREILDALNAGLTQTVNLVEYLVVDHAKLLAAVAPALGLDATHPALTETIRDTATLGVIARERAIGAAIWAAAQTTANRRRVLARILKHRSDLVRNWAGSFLACDASLTLPQRLAAARPLAADRHGGTREIAWLSVRPFILDQPAQAFRHLLPWAADPDENVRRFAVELTRPRGVWCAHIESLKADPSPGLPLLEAVRSDPADYVRRSCGNWLNDASKSRPDWVREICKRWENESRTPETRWIVKHALRTLRKPAARKTR